jgi:hypothetical protein
MKTLENIYILEDFKCLLRILNEKKNVMFSFLLPENKHHGLCVMFVKRKKKLEHIFFDK